MDIIFFCSGEFPSEILEILSWNLSKSAVKKCAFLPGGC